MIDTDHYELHPYLTHIHHLAITSVRMKHVKCEEFVSAWSDPPSMKQLINTMYIHELECDATE